MMPATSAHILRFISMAGFRSQTYLASEIALAILRQRAPNSGHRVSPSTDVSPDQSGRQQISIEPGFGKELRQVISRVEHSRFHRVWRHLDDLGNLIDGLFVIVDEIDDLSMRR